MFQSIFRPQGGVSVIAEPANCHHGSVAYLTELTRAVKVCGADAIKFQIFEPDHLAVPDYEWYKVYEEVNVPLKQWVELIGLAKSLDLAVVAEVFDVSAARFCLDQHVDAFKLNIADVLNRELTECLGQAQTAIFLSVGGSLIEEIHSTLDVLRRTQKPLVLNYGIQNYPTALAHSQLAKIRLLSCHFGLPVCYADHLAGDHPMAIELPCLAVTAGATSIEKHIILERDPQRYDYYSAIEPLQFKRLVDRLRDVEVCLGSSTLDLSAPERQYRELHKKCPVSKTTLPAGHQLRLDDLQFKRANGEKEFVRLEEAVGRTLAVALQPNTPIRKAHLT